MKHNSCINLHAQSSVAASVAIAVAAATSGVAARPLPPAGYGPVSAEHLAYLKKSGFPESCLGSLSVFSTQNLDGFTIRVGSELIEYITSGPVVVMGDADFASNVAINISGNRDFFMNVVGWLSQQENLIAIRPKEAGDSRLTLTNDQARRIAWLALLILGVLAFAGLGIANLLIGPPSGTSLSRNAAQDPAFLEVALVMERACLNCHSNIHGSTGPSTRGQRFVR